MEAWKLFMLTMQVICTKYRFCLKNSGKNSRFSCDFEFFLYFFWIWVTIMIYKHDKYDFYDFCLEVNFIFQFIIVILIYRCSTSHYLAVA